MKKQTFFYTKILFLLFFILIVSIRLITAQDVKKEKTVNIRLGLPFDVLDDLTRKDAQFAMDLWIKEIVQLMEKRTNISFNASAVFLENDIEQMGAAFNKEYDIFVLSGLDYFDFNLEKFWEPVALTRTEGHFPEEYLVLTRKDTELKDIKDLSGKRIVFSKNQDERIILYWLDYFLHTNHLGRTKEFFELQETVSKDSKAILNVFFKKVDACVVGYNQFITMTELNPQIGRQLRIVLESPPFARGLVCLNKSLNKQVKKIVTEAVLELPKYQRGKQILAFFGQSNLIASQSQYLDSFRKLVKGTKALDKKR